MVQFDTTIAQEKSRHSIEWKVAEVLPSSSDGKKHLGLAGAIVGCHKKILIVGGGANFQDKMPWFGGERTYCDDVFVFLQDEKGTIKRFDETYKLPFPIAYGASCTTPNGIVYAGGENEEGLSNKVLLMQWNELANRIDFTSLPQLPFALANTSITSIGNTLYVAGGEMSDNVSDMFFALDLDNESKGWKEMPRLPYQVSHSVIVSQSNGINDCIYMIGGRKGNKGSISTLYSTVFQFDPKTNQWVQKANLPYNLSAGTGMALEDKSILLFGGDRGETFHVVESFIISINNETDPLKKEMLNQGKIIVQTNHPGFSRTIIEFDTVENVFSTGSTMEFDVPVTTAALFWGNKIVIPSGEIKAGIRTPNILSGQLK